MSKMKKILLAVVIIVLVVFAGYKTWQKVRGNGGNNQIAAENAKVILFYGDLCPHCQDVDKYIEEHKIEQKVVFSRLEVWGNKENANLMAKKAQECGLRDAQLGVPFLWAEGKCFMGGPEVEKFLDGEAQKK